MKVFLFNFSIEEILSLFCYRESCSDVKISLIIKAVEVGVETLGTQTFQGSLLLFRLVWSGYFLLKYFLQQQNYPVKL